jgi:branched-chain amino acid transport system ATP-binding protein
MTETPPAAAPAVPLLSLADVDVVYDQMILGLRGVSLAVPEGAIVALLGANGAGKTTTLKAASGLLAAEGGTITRGRVTYRGASVLAAAPRELVRQGLAQVLEGRHCFAHLTVEENLTAGALVRRPNRALLAAELARVYAIFPRLAERRRGATGLLSGGEQQMVAVGRALMSRPRLLLLDEPSMGLAPRIVHELFAILAQLNREERVTILLAEQNATLALRFADIGYVLENGRVVASGPAADLADRDDVKNSYLGVSGGQRRRFGRRPAALPPTSV